MSVNEAQTRFRCEGIPVNLPITIAGYPDMRHTVCRTWVQEQVEMAYRTGIIPPWVPRNPDGMIDERENSARPFIPVQREILNSNSWFSCFGLCAAPRPPPQQPPAQMQSPPLYFSGHGHSHNNAQDDKWFSPSNANTPVVRHEPERGTTVINSYQQQQQQQPIPPPIVLQPVYVAPPPAPQTQSAPIIVQNYPPPPSSPVVQTRAPPPNNQQLRSEIPSNVPETRRRLPDMRTTPGREWVKSEARRLGRNYPSWLPKNADGSPDIREATARLYVEELQTLQNTTTLNSNAYWRQRQPPSRPASIVRDTYPRTSTGLPDVRTRDGRAWVLSQAQRHGQAVPDWVPRRADGSVNTSIPAARMYMEFAGIL